MTPSSPPSDPGDQRWPESPPFAGGYQIPAPSTQGTRPKEVEFSFWLWIGYLLLDAVGGSALVLTQGTPAIPDQTATLVIGLLVDAAMLAFAFFMRDGRNWARIVLTVLGSLRLLVALFLMIAGAAGALAAVLFLLVGAALVTMFLPAANPWFRPRQPTS